jgi:hypothetical protein
MSLAAGRRDWVVGFLDETWWSRLAKPSLHTWTEGAMRLVTKALSKTDTEPKALACYGVLRTDTNRVLLRFVEGRPVSRVTIDFLTWVVARLAQARKRVFVLVWDNASWHISQMVRTWIRVHNRAVKTAGKGVRILECRLPSKSPWLNPIEPHWMHGKRAIVEPERVLTAEEVVSRVYEHFACRPTPYLVQHVL